jgi:hypothetical protein
VRESGWFCQTSSVLLPREEVERRVAWLIATVREEAPDLVVERPEWNAARLVLGGPAAAERFRAALVAENMHADLDGAAVLLRVEPWFTPADVESLALAVAKVAHYLGTAA